MRGDGAVVEDASALRLLATHDAERLPGTEEDARQIDVHNSLPLLERDLVRVTWRRAHSGVVEKQIDSAVSGDGALEQVAYRLLVGHICRDRVKRQIWMSARKLLQRRTPPGSHHYCPTIPRESDRSSSANSGAPSGYYGYLRHPHPLSVQTFRNDVCMQIAILGTGAVGPALSRGLSAAGHFVVIGTRDPDQTRQREEWAGVDLPLAAYQDLDAEVFINATSGSGSLPALQAVGDTLKGKVVIDAANPLDFSQGFPPSLFVSNTDSLAEQLQREFPEARVVKMFNTMANEVMINPRGLGNDSTIFVAGNDASARQTAASIAADLGWTDVFDLGDLTAARGLEMYLPLWIRIFGQLGRPEFNIKVIR